MGIAMRAIFELQFKGSRLEEILIEVKPSPKSNLLIPSVRETQRGISNISYRLYHRPPYPPGPQK